MIFRMVLKEGFARKIEADTIQGAKTKARAIARRLGLTSPNYAFYIIQNETETHVFHYKYWTNVTSDIWFTRYHFPRPGEEI